ncbi:MAG: hypothetical protein ABFR95_08720 [Actinomycetota bacterium]
MPRPSKKISQGRLEDQADSPRTQSWTKYGGPETADGHRGSSNTVEVSADDITVVYSEEDSASKYMMRGMSAYAADSDSEPAEASELVPEFVREWVIDRSVEGRIYRRTDRLILVELDG